MAKILSMPVTKETFPIDLLEREWSPNVPNVNVTLAGTSGTQTYIMQGKTPVINDNVLQGTVNRRTSNGDYTDIEVSTDGATWTALSLPSGQSQQQPISVSLSAYNGEEIFIRAIAKNLNPNAQTFVPIIALSIY